MISRQLPAPMDWLSLLILGAGTSAPRPAPARAFSLVVRIVEGEPLMHRIETVVLVSLYALLAPLIITLALH